MIELSRVSLRVDCMEPDTFVLLSDLLMLRAFLISAASKKDCE